MSLATCCARSAWLFTLLAFVGLLDGGDLDFQVRSSKVRDGPWQHAGVKTGNSETSLGKCWLKKGRTKRGTSSILRGTDKSGWLGR